ncbi:MAG: hypothetical protein R3C58_04845 [Parvularculaceae bacterium]
MRNIFKTGLVGLAFGAIAASPAFAAPMFLASIDATLTLVDISVDDGDPDADVSGLASLIFADASHTGDADSSHSETLSPFDPTPLSEGPLSISLNANGTAMGIGNADALALADSIVTILNFSEVNTLRLDFLLEYSLTALAAVDDVMAQFATAATNFSVLSSQDFDPIVEFAFLADTQGPDTAFSVSDMLQFSIFVGPQNEASLSILSDVSGFVISDIELEPITDVPVPGVAGLFALAAFAALRRRSAPAA